MTDHRKNIATVIDQVKFAMLTTVTPEGHLHACPMTTTQTDLSKNEIWFIGDKTTETVKDIEKNPQINLSYSSPDHKDFVSITGQAELVVDKAKLDELWSPVYNAFFEQGKEDPNLQLIKIVPHGAEYWLSGNSVVNVFKMTVAAIKGNKISDSLGENHSFTF